MFPTAHDITPEVMEPCRQFLIKLLDPGNEVLLVSKPHLVVMKYLWMSDAIWAATRKGRLTFRFSIGSHSDKARRYWEPGAPSIDERIECIKFIRESDGKVGVSSEPLLEPWNVSDMAAELLPLINDTWWIGPINHIAQRVQCVTGQDYHEAREIGNWQTPALVREMYEKLKAKPQVRWKDAYKRLLGLPLAEKVGQDA
jgi:hypothetical protein